MTESSKSLMRFGIHTLIANVDLPYALRKSSSISESEWKSLRSNMLSMFNHFNPNDFNPVDESSDSGSKKIEIDEINNEILCSWLNYMSINEISIDDMSEAWSLFIASVSQRPIDDLEYYNETVGEAIESYYSSRRHTPDMHVMAATFIDDFNWEKYFKSASSTSGYCLRYPTSRLIVDNYARTNKDGFSSFMSENVFSKTLSHETRSFYYPYYIKNGYLTKKDARRLRSESSASASLSGLKSLFENKDSYANFEELVTQFVDSKYSDVTYYLAKELPISMLSYLVGCDDYHTKRKVRARMEDHLMTKDV